MKKTLAILFILVMTMSLVALTGCGGGEEGEAPSADSPYIGSYKAVSAEFQGEKADLDDVMDGAEIILELHEDGSAVLSSTDDSGTSEGTWTVLENGVKVKGDDIDMEFTATEDGGLQAEMFGFVLTFAKQ